MVEVLEVHIEPIEWDVGGSGSCEVRKRIMNIISSRFKGIRCKFDLKFVSYEKKFPSIREFEIFSTSISSINLFNFSGVMKFE